MIEKLKKYAVGKNSQDDIENKINELVDFANGITKSMVEHTVIQLDGEKVVSSAESTEKMYSIDEVAKLMLEYALAHPCAFSLDINGNAKDNWCAEHCGRCYDVNYLNCWKHAIEAGWMEGENG